MKEKSISQRNEKYRNFMIFIRLFFN